jgi:predicted permease
MAIVIEEEKKSSNILAFLGWIVVLAIIVAAIYYIFFVEPPSAVILPTGTLQSVGSLPMTSVNPQDVLNNDEFRALQQYVPEPTSTGPVPVGRANPFIAS